MAMRVLNVSVRRPPRVNYSPANACTQIRAKFALAWDGRRDDTLIAVATEPMEPMQPMEAVISDVCGATGWI
jgi:hypothetical protein